MSRIRNVANSRGCERLYASETAEVNALVEACVPLLLAEAHAPLPPRDSAARFDQRESGARRASGVRLPREARAPGPLRVPARVAGRGPGAGSCGQRAQSDGLAARARVPELTCESSARKLHAQTCGPAVQRARSSERARRWWPRVHWRPRGL